MWSDVWLAMNGVVSLLTEVSHDEAKNERFAVARRETRKRIALFKDTKHDVSLYRRYLFYTCIANRRIRRFYDSIKVRSFEIRGSR